MLMPSLRVVQMLMLRSALHAYVCCPTGQGPTGGVDWAISATTFVCAAALFGWWYLSFHSCTDRLVRHCGRSAEIAEVGATHYAGVLLSGGRAGGGRAHSSGGATTAWPLCVTSTSLGIVGCVLHSHLFRIVPHTAQSGQPFHTYDQAAEAARYFEAFNGSGIIADHRTVRDWYRQYLELNEGVAQARRARHV